MREREATKAPTMKMEAHMLRASAISSTKRASYIAIKVEGKAYFFIVFHRRQEQKWL